jgi:ABC-type multidrug transport system ATPase subunit
MKGKKTVILVTHQTSYLYDCDSVIIMEGGHISDHDTPSNLK